MREPRASASVGQSESWMPGGLSHFALRASAAREKQAKKLKRGKRLGRASAGEAGGWRKTHRSKVGEEGNSQGTSGRAGIWLSSSSLRVKLMQSIS
jgi:hypothetical protein